MYKKSIRTSDFLIEKVRRGITDESQQFHFHPYYEIGYLAHGTRQMTINDRIYSMKKGDIIIVKKNNLHKGSNVTKPNEYLEWIGMYFTESHLDEFKRILPEAKIEGLLDTVLIRLPKGRRNYAEELIIKLISEYNKIDALSPLLVTSYYNEFLSLLFRYSENSSIIHGSWEAEDSLILSATEYIFNNYQAEITLENISKKYNMSQSAFSKKFKAVTSCGFKEYLINVRIKNACDLLIDTDMNITAIALACGFSDSNYFGDAFRKIKGVSPNKYRKNKGLI